MPTTVRWFQGCFGTATPHLLASTALSGMNVTLS